MTACCCRHIEFSQAYIKYSGLTGKAGSPKERIPLFPGTVSPKLKARSGTLNTDNQGRKTKN